MELSCEYDNITAAMVKVVTKYYDDYVMHDFEIGIFRDNLYNYQVAVGKSVECN